MQWFIDRCAFCAYTETEKDLIGATVKYWALMTYSRRLLCVRFGLGSNKNFETYWNGLYSGIYVNIRHRRYLSSFLHCLADLAMFAIKSEATWDWVQRRRSASYVPSWFEGPHLEGNNKMSSIRFLNCKKIAVLLTGATVGFRMRTLR